MVTTTAIIIIVVVDFTRSEKYRAWILPYSISAFSWHVELLPNEEPFCKGLCVCAVGIALSSSRT